MMDLATKNSAHKVHPAWRDVLPTDEMADLLDELRGISGQGRGPKAVGAAFHKLIGLGPHAKRDVAREIAALATDLASAETRENTEVLASIIGALCWRVIDGINFDFPEIPARPRRALYRLLSPEKALSP